MRTREQMREYQRARRAKVSEKIGCQGCAMRDVKIDELKKQLDAMKLSPTQGALPLTCAPAAKELAKKLGVAKDALDGKQSRPPYALCPKCHIMNERCMCK